MQVRDLKILFTVSVGRRIKDVTAKMLWEIFRYMCTWLTAAQSLGLHMPT